MSIKLVITFAERGAEPKYEFGGEFGHDEINYIRLTLGRAYGQHMELRRIKDEQDRRKREDEVRKRAEELAKSSGDKKDSGKDGAESSGSGGEVKVEKTKPAST